jgi:DNA ligase D-like protein (predicted ligase)
MTPASFEPMLATLTDQRFSDPAWLFERKWDGERCVASRRDGTVALYSRNHLRLNDTYPELVDALLAQAPDNVMIDGEIVAFDGPRTSFAKLQARIGIHDADRARASGVRVFYYVFDLIDLDGQSTMALPLTWRKRLLKAAIQFDDPLRFTAHRVTAGEQAFAEACARGDEGVVAKRADAGYVHGRSPDWLKFKCVHDQEFVVVGYTDPRGSRAGFGALLLGYYEGDQLVYAGKVGTGFSQASLIRLAAQLTSLRQPNPDLRPGVVREKDVHWVAPRLVAQVGFTEWTTDGRLRHPRFLGLRDDKDARGVVRETS